MSVEKEILLCCDLDRTVLPNGSQPEDPEARPAFAAVVERPQVTLAYVSGRSRKLLEEALADYLLPEPSYAVGDVGSTIFTVEEGRWLLLDSWHEEIAPDWGGRTRDDLERLIGEVAGLELQEPAQQARYKLSYYGDLDRDREKLLAPLRRALADAGVDASVIWSVDESNGTGLVDVLPASATKRHAVEFLAERLSIPEERLVYAGDSGNDLPVLTSGLQAVLVANARAEVRDEARREAEDPSRLYLAQGGFHGLNGNYCSGVLEGLAHFLPETESWTRAAVSEHRQKSGA